MLQIAIRRADNARIQLLFLVVADSRENAVLQYMQQFRLQAGIELRNLVQEKRATVGHFHPARFALRALR